MTVTKIYHEAELLKELKLDDTRFRLSDSQPFYVEFSPSLLFGESEIGSINCRAIILVESGITISPQNIVLNFVPNTENQYIHLKTPSKNVLIFETFIYFYL